MRLATALDRVADSARLDRLVEPARSAVQRLVRPGPLKDVLHGVRLGHPLHPALAQVPLGAWISAGILDLRPGNDEQAGLLIGVGLVAALPAAAAGSADWSESEIGQRRVGLVHAAGNSAAMLLYAAALLARARARPGLGRVLGFAGLGVTGAAAGIGGHLAYHQGAGTTHSATSARTLSHDWIDLGPLDDLPEGRPVLRTDSGSDRHTALCVVRRGGRAHVVVDACSHLGGPLHDGELLRDRQRDCIQCPWHGAVFALKDGTAVRGPATAAVTVLRTRTTAGRLEARLPDRHLD